MSKCLLHIDKLQAFKDWLDSKGISHREGIGTYQVLQVFQQAQWMGVFKRDRMIEHLTVDVRLEELVRAFKATPINKYTKHELEYYTRLVEETVCYESELILSTTDCRVLHEMLKHLKELTK